MAAQDLTNLQAVKAWLAITSSSDDQLIGGCITAASMYFLWRTGRDSLNSVASYQEWYDGSGSMRQFVRNYPIAAVASVQIDGAAIPQSTDHLAPGWVIDRSAKSISIVGGGRLPARTGSYVLVGTGYGSYGGGFRAGRQNVYVSYSAGYAAAPADVADAINKMVAVNYKRRQWIDQKSQNISGVGVVEYRDWELPPEVERVINAYTRLSLP